MELVKEVAAAVLAAGILWAFGVSYLFYRKVSDWIRARKLRARLASGAFSADALAAATRYYVRPLYSNLDPANEWEPMSSLINARADPFSMADRFFAA